MTKETPSITKREKNQKQTLVEDQQDKEAAKKLWKRKQSYRKKVQEKGGNVIFADEWDKIDPGLKKGIGLAGGGISQRGLGRAFKKGGKV